MKKFFQNAVNLLGSLNEDGNGNSSNNTTLESIFLPTPQPSNKPQGIARAQQSPGQNNADKLAKTPPISPQVITSAAVLSDEIHKVLNNPSVLSGENFSGFERLVDVLEASRTDERTPDSEYGHVQILLNNIAHPNFAETCGQIALATSLMHALRILRMFEIKIAKNEIVPSHRPLKGDSRGVTCLASQRLSIIFRVLFSDYATVEKFRQSMVKFLCFPLNPLPFEAAHLQADSAAVLEQMCKTGFSSQQVWYLHDQQAIAHMVNHMSELTGLTGPEYADIQSDLEPACNMPDDPLLRGMKAEAYGFWVVGLESLVSVITSTVGVSPVLMGDFDDAGGFHLFTNIMKHTSDSRIMNTINIMVRLLSDPQKGPDEAIQYPQSASIFFDLLLYALQLDKGIELDDSIAVMIAKAKRLLVRADRVQSKEGVIQNISYMLLTLYSNDPRNCNMLEEHFHFLPLLLISLPSVTTADTVSAVLTALNYVCQCVESAATIPIISLCASSAVVIEVCLDLEKTEEERKAAATRLEALFSSFEAMVRSQTTYAVTLVRCGMLQHLFFDNFDRLKQLVVKGEVLDASSVVVFEKMIDLLVCMNHKNPRVSDEVRRHGLHDVVRDLIAIDCVPDSLIRGFLRLMEQIAGSDTSHLEDALQALIHLLRACRARLHHVALVIQSLTKILVTIEEAPQVWRAITGFSALLEVVCLMDGVFLETTPEQNGSKVYDSDAKNATTEGNKHYTRAHFEGLSAAMNCLAADVTMTIFNKGHPEYESHIREFRHNYQSLSKSIRNTGVFGSAYAFQAVDLVMNLASGYGSQEVIVNPQAVYMVVELLPHVPSQLGVHMLRKLKVLTDGSLHGRQLLSEVGIAQLLMEKFGVLVLEDKDELGHELRVFIRHLMSSYLTLHDFSALVRYFVRYDIAPDEADCRLIPANVAFDEKVAEKVWKSVSILEEMAMVHSDVLDGIPFVPLGTSVSTKDGSTSLVRIIMSESTVSFPLGGFTFSFWVQASNPYRVPYAEEPTQVIPLISISAPSAYGCFFEAHLDVRRGFIRILTKKDNMLYTLRYQPAFSLKKSKWNSIIISVKRPKRFGANKSNISVYVNGLACTPFNGDTLTIDYPTVGAGALFELIAGKFGMEKLPLSPDAVVGDDELMDELVLPKVWRLGPFALFDDAVSQNQVATIFMKGPAYAGLYQASAPLCDYLASVSSDLLVKCNTTDIAVDTYLDSLGMAGLEYVIDPAVESASFTTNSYEVMILPQTLFSYNAYYSTNVYNYAATEKGERVKISLLNTVCPYSNEPEASLDYCQGVSLTESVGSCVSALGGPDLFFPVLQAASNAAQLVQFFKLLKACVKTNITNLKYMQIIGYKVCAFIMSIKPQAIFTDAVLDAIFEIVLHENPAIPGCALFVDTCAFYYLLMNVQIWKFTSPRIPRKLVGMLERLLTDMQYAELNAKRLSCLGMARWILQLTVFAVEKATASMRQVLPSQAASQGSLATGSDEDKDRWWVRMFLCMEDVESNNDKDAFITSALKVLYHVIQVDTRKRDLDLVANTIIFTLNPHGENADSSYVRRNTLLTKETSGTDLEVTPFGTLRIFLLKFLISIYEISTNEVSARQDVTKQGVGSSATRTAKDSMGPTDSPSLQVFRSALSPEVFLCFLDKVPDITTLTYIVRLLALMIHRDPLFQHGFCALGGFEMINIKLVEQSQGNPLLGPFLAILFRVSVSSIPQTITSKDELLAVIDDEKCPGCDGSEHGMQEISMPILHLILQCISIRAHRDANNRHTSEPTDKTNRHVVEVLRIMIDRNTAFRKLFQQRRIVTALAEAMLACSDAVHDFGSHMYTGSGDDETCSLIETIKDDYVDDRRLSESYKCREITEAVEKDTVLHESIQKLECNPEGQVFIQMVQATIHAALQEFGNPIVLSLLMLSFPQNMVESRINSYHFALVNIVKVLLDGMLESAVEQSHLTSLISLFTYLVPLTRAGVLDDTIIIEVFELSTKLLRRANMVFGSKTGAWSDRLLATLRDAGATARYFAVFCIRAAAIERQKSEELQSRFLHTVRINLHLLLLSTVSDDSFDFAAVQAVKLSKDNEGGVSVLEALQIALNQETSQHSQGAIEGTILTSAKVDRQHLSQTFCISILCSCFRLINDSKISHARLESLRICAALTVYRRSLIELLVSNILAGKVSRGTITAEDVGSGGLGNGKQAFLCEGLDILVPPLERGYEQFLRGETEKNEGETDRIADFDYWYADNRERCNKFFWPVDVFLASVSPSQSEVDEIIRQLQSIRARDAGKLEYAPKVVLSFRLSEDSRRHSHMLESQVRRWQVHGFLYLASGAIQWRKIWQAMESAQLWGYIPSRLGTAIASTGISGEALSELTDRFHWNGIDSDRKFVDAYEKKMWRLNFTEGPERMRKRLEPDFSMHHFALGKNGVWSPRTPKTPMTPMTPRTPTDHGPVTAAGSAAVLDMLSRNDSTDGLLSPRSEKSVGFPIENVSASSGNSASSSSEQIDFIRDSADMTPPSSSSSKRRSWHETDLDPNNLGGLKSLTKMEVFLKSLAEKGLKIRKHIHNEAISHFFDTEENTTVASEEASRISEVSMLASATTSPKVLSPCTTGMPPGSVASPRRRPQTVANIDTVEYTANRFQSLRKYSELGLEKESDDEFDGDVVLSGPASPIPEPDDATLTSKRSSSPIQGARRLTDTGPTGRAGSPALSTAASSKTSFTESTKGTMRPRGFRIAKTSMSVLELVKGLIGSSEWYNGKAYNVSRIYGLEVQPSLLIVSSKNVHLLNGFRMKPNRRHSADKSLEWLPLKSYDSTSIQMLSSLGRQAFSDTNILVAPKPRTASTDETLSSLDAATADDPKWIESVWGNMLDSDFICDKICFEEVQSILKRRYQLKPTALEVSSINGLSLLFSFSTINECDDVLRNLLEAEMPASICHRHTGIKNLEMLRSTGTLYNRLLGQYTSSVTRMWQNGEVSNFEYLMHLNFAAGRSYQDLTQYPVFPWVLADYTSESLDLNDPRSFRDLSKPMGAQGTRRARQYQERYNTMNEFKQSGVEGTPPAFHYGTHYSCAGYVLNYLIRLQPFSNMAIALQGGHVDLADRLFLSIRACWESASKDNLQDVRELIPEFFYQPDFLMNRNNFGFGTTQTGEKVHDVILPPWARNNPREFIRLHRQALESKYVSENLHHWIDLIFGYKQRGQAAEDAMNVFIHLTYDDEVDIDSITDPVLRKATIDQINNFGQTPSRLFSKPHPKRVVPEILKRSNDIWSVDATAVGWHSHLSPPLCLVGAKDLVQLSKTSYAQTTYVGGAPKGTPVGDIRLQSRDRVLAVPVGCVLIPQLLRRYVKTGGPAGSVYVMHVNKEADKDMAFEALHQRVVTCVAVGRRSQYMVTGSEDMSVRLWNINAKMSNRKLDHVATFSGHFGTILAVDLNVDYQVIISGSADCTACLWDVHSGKLLRVLTGHDGPVVDVSMSGVSGSVATLTANQLRLWTVNGELISSVKFTAGIPGFGDTAVKFTRGKVVSCPPCADWQDGVVAITGHESGNVHLWKLRTEITNEVSNPDAPVADLKLTTKIIRRLIPHTLSKTHRAPISAIKLCPISGVGGRIKEGVEKVFDDVNACELIVGDTDGYVSRWTNQRLDILPSSELQATVSRAAQASEAIAAGRLEAATGKPLSRQSTRLNALAPAMMKHLTATKSTLSQIPSIQG